MNLEKLANHIALQSIVEGGMEKQALDLGQLLRMGRTFALRGKADRFNKLMDRRAQALSAVRTNRRQASQDAFDEMLRTDAYLTYGDVNPVLGKVRSAQKRNPLNPIRIERDPDPQDRIARVTSLQEELARMMSKYPKSRDEIFNRLVDYNSDQLAAFSNALKRLDLDLHRKVLTTGSV